VAIGRRGLRAPCHARCERFRLHGAQRWPIRPSDVANVDGSPLRGDAQAPDAARDLRGTPVAVEGRMSEEPAKAADTPSAPKSSKAVLGLLVLNFAATGFIAFKVVTTTPASAATVHDAPPPPPTAEVTGPVVALDPFVVNLDEPGTARYLKVTLQLELLHDAEASLTKSKELVRDAILGYLSGLHVKDTLGAEAKDKIRGELMAKLEKLIGPNKVRRMFFQEFVVQ
jgi:flagellar FliL protein